MILRMSVFAALGLVAVFLPVILFAYTPWLRDLRNRVVPLLCTIAVLSAVVILVALNT